MKNKIFLFSLLMFLFIPHINAAQGCCSYHGGISYCGSSGYYICNDGTRSPSCTCSSGYSEIISEGCPTNCSAFAEEIENLEKENERLIKEKNKLQEDNTTYQWFVIILGIIAFVLFLKQA